MTILTPDKTLFESKTCSRCGGLGAYSYNAVHGTRCYGCAGQGVQLTKRGAAASKLFRELCSRRAEDLKVGDGILWDMFFFSCWAPITAIESTENGSVKISGIRAKTGETMSYTADRNSPVRLKLTAEQKAPLIAQARAYQESLTDSGKPRKRAAAARMLEAA